MNQPLTPEQRSWLAADEERWHRARRIVEQHPEADLHGIYRVLRNLEKTPAERLRDALQHGRLFSLYRR